MTLGGDAFEWDGSRMGNEAAAAGNFALNQIKSADTKGFWCIFESVLPFFHADLPWAIFL